ncbi:MAG: hypothetical protein ACE37D_02965 [Pseudomonadales bacterium]
MDKILLTGFTPFDGRKINASWVAAQTFAAAEHLEIPVIWGEPMPQLQSKLEACQANIVISLGEGREGWFDIECRARNERKHRIDNLQQYPRGTILPGGPEVQFASINSQQLQQTLQAQGIGIRLSQDAGQFICEETLYSLETLKQTYEFLDLVTFVHLPPYGTSLEYQGEQRQVDEALLEDFVQRLVDAVKSLYLATSHASEIRG